MIQHRLPSEWNQPENVTLSGFDSTLVFSFVGADHLNVQKRDPGARGYFAPRFSAFDDRVHTVNDDRAAQLKITQSQLIGDEVSTAPHFPGNRTRISDGLFNGVDPQIYGA